MSLKKITIIAVVMIIPLQLWSSEAPAPEAASRESRKPSNISRANKAVAQIKECLATISRLNFSEEDAIKQLNANLIILDKTMDIIDPKKERSKTVSDQQKIKIFRAYLAFPDAFAAAAAALARDGSAWPASLKEEISKNASELLTVLYYHCTMGLSGEETKDNKKKTEDAYHTLKGSLEQITAVHPDVLKDLEKKLKQLSQLAEQWGGLQAAIDYMSLQAATELHD